MYVCSASQNCTSINKLVNFAVCTIRILFTRYSITLHIWHLPGIPALKWVYKTFLLLVHSKVCRSLLLESPIQKCFSGRIPTKLTRKAFSILIGKEIETEFNKGPPKKCQTHCHYNVMNCITCICLVFINTAGIIHDRNALTCL